MGKLHPLCAKILSKLGHVFRILLCSSVFSNRIIEEFLLFHHFFSMLLLDPFLLSLSSGFSFLLIYIPSSFSVLNLQKKSFLYFLLFCLFQSQHIVSVTSEFCHQQYCNASLISSPSFNSKSLPVDSYNVLG